ncbi:MAG: hypothetical protein AABX98_06590 [Nanoarchaeota archaeon]
MVSNTERNRTRKQEHKERTDIGAALLAFQQIESGQSIIHEEIFDSIADRFFATGDTIYGTSTGIQTLVREGYSLERPISSLRSDTSYILASLGAEVIDRTSSVNILLESPGQDIQYRVALLTEHLLYRQMDVEDKAMTRLCEKDVTALSTVQYERNVLSALLEEFSSVDIPDLDSALESHNFKMREYATLCLENAASHALETLHQLFDQDAPKTTYLDAKAAFASLYAACSELYGMQRAFRNVTENYRGRAHAAAVDYITGELAIYRELIETAKGMSGGDREELTAAVQAITVYDNKMRTAFRKTHQSLTSTEFREYTRQYSALHNDEGYTHLTTEISGPQHFDDDFANTVTKQSRVTAIIPIPELAALVERRYDDLPTVIRAPRAVDVQPSL